MKRIHALVEKVADIFIQPWNNRNILDKIKNLNLISM
jgi:hypothetical protein